MSRMVWWAPGYYPLATSGGVPAASAACCCSEEESAAQASSWPVARMNTPDEYVPSDWVTWDIYGIAGFGDMTLCSSVWGGQMRTMQLAVRWENVPFPFLRVLTTFTVTFDVASVTYQHPFACGAIIEGNIVGHAHPDSPKFWDGSSGVSHQTLDTYRRTQRTGAEVPWWLNKPDPDDCGTPTITTPNLAAIVNEIVATPGWVQGNALTLFFEGQLQWAASYVGMVELDFNARTIRKLDGGNWADLGFASGQLVDVHINGRPWDSFTNCVWHVTGDEMEWTQAGWQSNGQYLAFIQAKVVTTAGWDSPRPATQSFDYIANTDVWPITNVVFNAQ